MLVVDDSSRPQSTSLGALSQSRDFRFTITSEGLRLKITLRRAVA